MKRIIIFLICIISLPELAFADRDGNEYIYIRKKNNGGHIEYYEPADMPDVYYNSGDAEILIIAYGFSSFYDVEIYSQTISLTLISTQISGYGDTIDVSSLPADNYVIIITSEFLNEYEGNFTIM